VATLEIEIGWRLNWIRLKRISTYRENFVKGEGAISLVTIELSLSAKNLENILKNRFQGDVQVTYNLLIS